MIVTEESELIKEVWSTLCGSPKSTKSVEHWKIIMRGYPIYRVYFHNQPVLVNNFRHASKTTVPYVFNAHLLHLL